MIDTACLKHVSSELTEMKLSHLGATLKPWRRNPTWCLNPAEESGLPRITISRSPDAMFHVFAEVSIPRFLYGHNARLPTSEEEVQRGLKAICEYTESLLEIRFVVESAVISKIHLTRDYYLGDAANEAVFSLFDKRLRHFPKRAIVADEGNVNTLYFNYASRRRNCVLCVYPKHGDMLARKGSQEALEASEGNLRFEYRANTPSGVKSLCNRFKVNDPSELLTLDLNDRVFNALYTELRFPQCISHKEAALTKLLLIYSDVKSQRLAGFCEMRRVRGDRAMTKSPSQRRNFNAARRDCERAGVWLNLRHAEE